MLRVPSRPFLLALTGWLVAGWLVAGEVMAWTPESQRAIAELAVRLAPPDLQRQLRRNRDAYRVGVEEPFRDPDPAKHFQLEDGSGRLAATASWAVEQATLSIRQLRPFNEIAYRLGVVSHYVADANFPLGVSRADPRQTAYADDFPRYLDSARPRFQVVFYGFRPGFAATGGVPRLVREAIGRSRGFYPHLGREYRRIGFGSGRLGFDDRSTAYGVGSLAFSHAVSDVGEVFRHVWLEAGGVDERPQLPARGRRIFTLPQTGD